MGMLGTGTTITFGTSSYACEIMDEGLDIDGEEVPVVDVSHMTTTGYRKKLFGKLVEPPQITVNINWDPDTPPPITAAAETITITFPLPAGMSTPATIAGTGKIISRSASVPLEDKMTGTFVVQFDGQTGPTFTAASGGGGG